MKRCTKCGQLKNESEFHKCKTRLDGLHIWCKTCSSESQANIQRRVRNRIELLKRKCAKCGEGRVYLIEFHHIDPQEKQFEIGKAASLHIKEDLILTEIEKCVCLCANCHKEFHYIYKDDVNNPVDNLTEYLGRNPYDV